MIGALRPASPRRAKAVEALAERLGAHAGKRRGPLELIGRHQVDRAEAARIVEAEPPSLLGLDQDMVVEPDLNGIDAPRARHAEMEDQGVAAVGLDQAVFARRPRGHLRAGLPLAQVRRKGPAQVVAAQLDRRDPPPLQHRGQAADGRLRLSGIPRRREEACASSVS